MLARAAARNDVTKLSHREIDAKAQDVVQLAADVRTRLQYCLSMKQDGNLKARHIKDVRDTMADMLATVEEIAKYTESMTADS